MNLCLLVLLKVTLKRRISNESPIGEAILGRRKGDVVKVKTPKGEILIKIMNIEK